MGKSTGRAVTATVLAILVALLTIPSVVLVWVNRQVLNSDRYIATVAPLAGDPEVQTAVTTRVTGELMTHLDLSALLSSMSTDLPPAAARGLQSLEGPIETALETFVHNTVRDVVTSEGFERIWVAANRAGHAALMSVLTGDGKVLNARGDTITVDLGPIVELAKNRLVSSGFQLAERIPPVNTQYTVVTSPSIAKAQQWYSLLLVLRWLVPLLALVLLAVALIISPNRRRTLLIAAICTVGAMILLAAATFIGRGLVAPDTSGTVYDTLIAPLRTDLRWVLAGALIIALGTWLYGYLRGSRNAAAA